MNLKEKNYKKSSGLDSVRFWLQGHRFVKFMLDIVFYIILFLVIEFTTSKKKGPLKDFVNPLFISISLASFFN